MPDESTDVAVIVRNDGRDDRNFVVVATLPEGWESDCTNDDLQDDIPTGTSREFVFEITPPEEGGEGRITWTLYWDVPAANDNTPIEYIDVPKNYGKGIVHQWVSTHETPERTMWLYRISALPTGVDAKAVEEVAVPEQAGSKVPLILLRGLEKEAALDADKRDAARESLTTGMTRTTGGRTSSNTGLVRAPLRCASAINSTPSPTLPTIGLTRMPPHLRRR
ncbi:MAG: hypothetical protein HUU29_01400 [Planctomycetaceae bacterium]|nr:hypothetical protein [Planctomycetaceae bacterium]